MPANTDFRADILVGGVVVPEYKKDDQYYVECNLNTPFTYKEKSLEVVNGEREEQEYPVTPYQIKLTALTGHDFPNYYRVRVDGVKVKGLSLHTGESRRIKGFRDGTSVRELLFSMPRFARDLDDRVDVQRRTSIGTIEIECWMATLQTRRTEMRVNNLDFQQANKKDSTNVTNGEYMMATSRVGKVVCERSFARTVDSWKLISLLSTLRIQYRMADSLREMGFNIKAQKFRLVGGSGSGQRRQILKRDVKDEPLDLHVKRKRRKGRGGKGQSEKHKEAAETLMNLQRRGPTPLPGTSSGGGDAPITIDDEMEIVGIVPGTKTSTRAEPVLIDLTDKENDIVTESPPKAFHDVIDVKEERDREDISASKKGRRKRSVAKNVSELISVSAKKEPVHTTTNTDNDTRPKNGVDVGQENVTDDVENIQELPERNIADPKDLVNEPRECNDANSNDISKVGETLEVDQSPQKERGIDHTASKESGEVVESPLPVMPNESPAADKHKENEETVQVEKATKRNETVPIYTTSDAKDNTTNTDEPEAMDSHPDEGSQNSISVPESATGGRGRRNSASHASDLQSDKESRENSDDKNDKEIEKNPTNTKEYPPVE